MGKITGYLIGFACLFALPCFSQVTQDNLMNSMRFMTPLLPQVSSRSISAITGGTAQGIILWRSILPSHILPLRKRGLPVI